MDQNQNPNYRPEDEQGTPAGGPPPNPPDMNDPQPPQYGDPVTPEPASPPPSPPPPGLDPGPASTPPPPPNYGAQPDAATGTGATGSLTNPTKDERNWAMFSHLSAIAAALIGLSFLGPLIIYLMKKDESSFVADQAKEALNFNISLLIAVVGLIILAILLVWTIIVPFLMPFIIGLLCLGALVLVIIAGIKASEGEVYRYPFTLRLIK